MDYVIRAKMIKNSFIWRSRITFLGISQKGNLMGYVSRPKMMKISFLQGSTIAFLGNSQKGNFDGLCNRVTGHGNAKNEFLMDYISRSCDLSKRCMHMILKALDEVIPMEWVMGPDLQKCKFDGLCNQVTWS